MIEQTFSWLQDKIKTNSNTDLTLSTLGKNFNEQILKYFSYFSLRRQFAGNVKGYFLGKLRKKISTVLSSA